MIRERRKKQEKIILYNLLITDAGAEGKAISKYQGIVVFIPFGAPGDIVDVEIIDKKKKFWEGNIINIVSPSPFREEAFCSHYGKCGGCKWQHLNYRQQLSTKQRHVKDCLERIAGIEEPNLLSIIPSDKTKYYRNKLEYTFGDRRWLSNEEIREDKVFDQRSLGFHIPGRYDKLIDINECFLQPDPSNGIRDAAKEFAFTHNLEFFNLRFKTGFVRNIIIRNNQKGEFMVTLVVSRNEEEILKEFTSFITNKFPQITSLYAAINDKLNDSLDNVPFVHLFGNTHLAEEMDGLKFQIAPASFFQTNTDQAIKLYETAINMINWTGDETVYDLYSGTGTISSFLARKAKKVIGVEYVEEAVNDGNANMKLNNITNVKLLHGDMSKMFNFDFGKRNGFPDIVFTDPPRAGMHPKVVSSIAEMKPKYVVYISCNPATQARDLAEMPEYELVKSQAIDMFPHTHHVENIVLLKLK